MNKIRHKVDKPRGRGAVQLSLLIKHFFNGFFENEEISPESNVRQKLLVVLILLSIISAYLSFALLSPYLKQGDKDTAWVEKGFFIGFFMIIIGVLSVIHWKAMIVDKRDYTILANLPVENKILFLAKFISLLEIMIIFFLATTIISSFIFPLFLLESAKLGVFPFLRFWGAHLISCFMAYFFVFFSGCLANAALVLILRPSLYERISTYFQLFLILLFSILMILLVTFFNLYPEYYSSSFSSLVNGNSSLLFYLPPFWFVGLYEYLLGAQEHVFVTLARMALGAVFLALALYIGLALVNYRRFLRGEGGRDGAGRFFRKKTMISKVFQAIFLRDSIQKAVFYFFLLTLKRVKKYKLILGGYIAIPISILIIGVLSSRISAFQENFFIFDWILLSLPQTVVLFLLVGTRVIAGFPQSLEANWLFKITEISDREKYLKGLRKAIFCLIILPACLFIYIFYSVFLSGEEASLLAIYGLLNSVILLNFFFFNYSKIPFACAYKTRNFNMSNLFLIGLFFLYIYGATLFGHYLLKNPHLFFYYVGLVGLVYLGLKVTKRLWLRGRRGIEFEESEGFPGLDL